VVSRLLDVSEIEEATQRETPDVAIVGVDGKPEQSHALELISAIVKQAACPVIADIDTDDDSFIEKAARRGIFAYVRHGEPPETEHAIDIVLNRYAEFARLHGALRTGAIIEQAKGILMERHAITADDAFARLLSQARNTNHTLIEVAEAVTLSYPLFRLPPPALEHAETES
jgi:AmiR/NasT family two-component response regulator